jgi:hypothetical protein
MAYSITTTSGGFVATVQDATINTTATSLTLIGRDYAGYGAFLNENFVHLMEHFAANTAPVKKLTGQIWYDTSVQGGGTLRVWNQGANIWKPVGSSISQAGAPASGSPGDLWFDTANNQLYAWSEDDSDWILIGPPSTLAGSGAVVTTIIDSSSNSHVVIQFKVNNNIVGIISYDATFTPQTAIAGFSTIKPGFNLVSTSTLTGAQFTGDASNALLLNGVGAGQFLRSDQNTATPYRLGVGNLVVGSDLTISAAVAENEVKFIGTTNNRDINFYANVGGNVNIRPIAISGSTGSVNFEKSVSINENLSAAGTLSVTGATTLVGAVTVQTGVSPTSNNTIDIGSTTGTFANVYAGKLHGIVNSTNVYAVTGTILNNLTVNGTIFIASNVVATQSYVTSTIATLGKNSQGNKTISASPPTGGSNGDIWYQI